MKINKNTAFVLLHILGGHSKTTAITEQMDSVNVRSVQRALAKLAELGIIARNGSNNNPSYTVNYRHLVGADISAKLLENEKRPDSVFNHRFVAWLKKLSNKELEELLVPSTPGLPKHPQEMSAKELEYLTVELSWKSSALEGNTYTLLDTKLLLLEGVKAKNKTEFETQMILNHKNAVSFIVEHRELFAGSNIQFKTMEELHRIIGNNLGIGAGVRKKPVRITASNYIPLGNPYQLRESADNILGIINRVSDPFTKALLALALIPYLQCFEDGNKRTGRMLANAILIHSASRGFSLRKTDAKQLALAYLAFYEFNSLRALSKILKAELQSQ
jgi:Fic family protein